MHIPFKRALIYGDNCQNQGRTKTKGDGGHLLAIVALIIVGLFFWPLLLAAAVYFLVVLVRPAVLLFPDCCSPLPVPLKKCLARQVPDGR